MEGKRREKKRREVNGREGKGMEEKGREEKRIKLYLTSVGCGNKNISTMYYYPTK